MNTFMTAVLAFVTFTSDASGQLDSLKSQILGRLTNAQATIGVAVGILEDTAEVGINGDEHFPMQSVFKFHIALAVLSRVDDGTLSLDQELHVTRKDLLPDTWSPLRTKYPEGNVRIALRDIPGYMVSQSDNNACDILLRLVGGTGMVNKFIHGIGIVDVSIQANEEEMHKARDAQFANWTTPGAALQLLRKFQAGTILSRENNDALRELMTASIGNSRIPGRLPTGTIVAHKTGTSGTNEQGITAAVNDIGIVTLPDGRHLGIAVFVSNSKETAEENESIIADVARLAWDFFVQNPEK